MQVDEADEKVVLTAFMGGLLPTKFLFSLSKSPLNNMVELMLRAQKHMNAEDAMVARRDQGNELRKLSKKKREEQSKGVDGATRPRDDANRPVCQRKAPAPARR